VYDVVSFVIAGLKFMYGFKSMNIALSSVVSGIFEKSNDRKDTAKRNLTIRKRKQEPKTKNQKRENQKRENQKLEN
jgi:cell shape-determining protein MreC